MDLNDVIGVPVFNKKTGYMGYIMCPPMNKKDLSGLTVAYRDKDGIEQVVYSGGLVNWVVPGEIEAPLMEWIRDYCDLSSNEVRQVLSSYIIDHHGYVYLAVAAHATDRGVHYRLHSTSLRAVLTHDSTGLPIYSITESEGYVMTPAIGGLVSHQVIAKRFSCVTRKSPVTWVNTPIRGQK